MVSRQHTLLLLQYHRCIRYMHVVHDMKYVNEWVWLIFLNVFSTIVLLSNVDYINNMERLC